MTDPMPSLTEREEDALESIARGETTKQTAARLKISFSTARTHRHNLLRKLGVHTAASAYAEARRRGWRSEDEWDETPAEPQRLDDPILRRNAADLLSRADWVPWKTPLSIAQCEAIVDAVLRALEEVQ